MAGLSLPSKAAWILFILVTCIVLVGGFFVFTKKPFPGDTCILDRQCGVYVGDPLKDICKGQPGCLPIYQDGRCLRFVCETRLAI